MNLKDKISQLTTVPVEHLDRLNNYINLIHSNDVVEEMLNNKDVIELSIFEGTILIKLEDDAIKYKFIPNKEFDELIVETVLNKKSKLLNVAVDKLKKALMN